MAVAAVVMVSVSYRLLQRPLLHRLAVDLNDVVGVRPTDDDTRARFEHDLELLLDEVLRRRQVGEAAGERVRADGVYERCRRQIRAVEAASTGRRL
jgi:hypothetical protein